MLLSVILHSCLSDRKKETSANSGEHSEDPAVEAEHLHAVPETEPARLEVINRKNYHTVEIRRMQFHPEELVVKSGDTVVWVNNGITAHDVTEQPSKAWTSSSMAVGESWQQVVRSSSDYYCSIHVVMKGRIVVK